MNANLLTVSLLVVSAAWTDAAVTRISSYVGVDPNTLSCDPEGHVFLLLPHFTDCDKYYVCQHGKEIVKKCNSNLIFDFEHQICNWDWATKCWLRTAEEEDGSGSGSGDGDDLDWAWNEPSIAKESAADVKPAPAPQFKNPLDCSNAQSATKLLAYKKDCQRYWRCAGGISETAYCTDGLFFNEAKQQCDFEANVKCEQTEELGDEFIVYK